MSLAATRISRRIAGGHGLAWALPAAALALVPLTGCSTLFGPSPPVKVETVGFRVSPQANQNSAVAVDLVLVKQQILVDTIGKLSAADWFARKAQFQRDFPDDIVVVSWELVPGQVILPANVRPDPKVWGAFFFARYAGAGEHRAAVGSDRSVIVTLDDDDLSIQSAK